MEGMVGIANAGLTFGGLVLAFFWKGEEALSPDLKKWLTGALKEARVSTPSTNWPQIFGHLFDRIFGVDAFRSKFVLMALLASVLSVSFFFFIYVINLPGFGASLLNDPFQRAAVMKRLLTTALFVNFVVDYLSIAYCREVVSQMEKSTKPTHIPLYLIKDLGMKIIIFIILMGLVYMNLADAGGFKASLKSFSLDLWAGLLFKNLTCVFIYGIS